jgi:predicted ribosome quality control (RQC) complex YloA/Tae2 family protein
MIKTIFIQSIQTNIDFIVGKNAKQNFEIIDDAKQNDLWFHIENESSCHVIAQLPEEHSWDKKQLRHIVKQGAVLCKAHSRYKSDKNVPIIYTTIQHLTKGDTIGSVIATNTKSVVI